ncbi:MAG TPA: DUF4434 domain-containing protein [Firmicutes bacterium]|nr:DUF4434 domain-containing protein [Bacillota bacterium]
MKKWMTLLMACLPLFPLLAGAVPARAAGKTTFKHTPITGSFIQPWLYNSFSEERMDKEFARMAEYGMDTLIMGDTARLPSGGDRWEVIYPTKLEELGGPTDTDQISILLEYCKKYDMKLYIGIGLEDDWWSRDLSNPDDAAWLKESCRLSAKIIRELYDVYAGEYGEAFGGYYWVHEIWNHNSWNMDTTRELYAQALADGFNIVLEAINEVDPTKPLLFSPFSTRVGFASKESMQAFYTRFFQLANFREIDAMLPMDNIGGGGQQLEYLDEWTKAYADAVKDSGSPIQFWSNCESFVQPKGDEAWTTCTVDRFVQQVEITSKYCSKIVSFSWNHYMSPYNTVEGFDRAYMDYLVTGELESNPPSLPEKMVASLENETLCVDWEPAQDDYGVARSYVYKVKDGKETLYHTNLVVRYDGVDYRPLLDNYFVDYDYDKTGVNVYCVQIMDCAGNLSEKGYVVVDGENPGSEEKFPVKTGGKGYYTEEEYRRLATELDLSVPEETTAPDSTRQTTVPPKTGGGVSRLGLWITVVTLVLLGGCCAAGIVLRRRKGKKRSGKADG